MNISAITDDLRACPCGRAHHVEIRAVEIGRGMLGRSAEILRDAGFPRRILAVADACLRCHPYMRDKIVLTRLLTMADVDAFALIGCA